MKLNRRRMIGSLSAVAAMPLLSAVAMSNSVIDHERECMSWARELEEVLLMFRENGIPCSLDEVRVLSYQNNTVRIELTFILESIKELRRARIVFFEHSVPQKKECILIETLAILNLRADGKMKLPTDGVCEIRDIVDKLSFDRSVIYSVKFDIEKLNLSQTNGGLLFDFWSWDGSKMRNGSSTTVVGWKE